MPLINSLRHLGVISLLWLGVSLNVQADNNCLFPDSQQGEAPAWLCDQQVAGWQYLGRGDKNHMPSISLQNRLAGKQAMRAVADALVEAANSKLANMTGTSLPRLAVKKRLDLLAELKVVKIIEKRSSPRRHLYVLAGVAEAEADRALYGTMRYLLEMHARPLQKQLGEAEFNRLQTDVNQLMEMTNRTEDSADE